MILKYKFARIGLAIILCSITQSVYSQKEGNSTKLAKNKVSTLLAKSMQEGFITYKAGEIRMERRTEFPIFVQLHEGRWYHFLVVGDPRATKFEMKLGLEGVGDFITDKFKPTTTNEFWSEFSFICPRSGRYLFTFYQRGGPKDLYGHVSIMQRPSSDNAGLYTYR